MTGNVMWMSDNFNAPSGFGQQTFHVVSRLTTGPEAIHIDNIGWQWAGNPALFNDKWRVLPSGGRFASAILPHHMKIYKPDLLITLADLWNVQYVLNMRREHDFTWLEWLPIDGKPISERKWTSTYNGIDVIVAMSDFGYNELQAGKKLWIEDLERDEPPTQIEKIYHGVPTDLLVPFDEDHRLALRQNYDWQDDFPFTSEIREDFIKGRKKLEDYFIYGIVARNQPRKSFPVLLQAWKDFAEDHDDVLLWMHTCPSDPAGANLQFVVDQLGISDSIVFSDSVSQWYGKSSPEMADVYNLFDCHFLPTRGEGFGIPTVEAMSCGLFIAVTDFTTGYELTDRGYAGYLMHCDREVIDPGHVLRVNFLKEEILVHLENIYNMNGSKRKQLGERARTRAVNTYNIENIVADWRNLIDKYTPGVPTARVHTLDMQLYYNEDYMRMREMDAQVEYAKNEYRFIGKYLEDEAKVLEIGCGSGEAMIFLTRHYNVRVLGSDLSEESIKMCRRKGLNVFQHDFSDYILPFKNNECDVVFSQHVLEHLDNDITPILETLRVTNRYAIHVVPHDNMRDKSHKRRYLEEGVQRVQNEVKEAYRGTGTKIKTQYHKNYVLDSNFDRNLVSYVMVFEKV